MRFGLEKDDNLAWLYNAQVTGVSEPQVSGQPREQPGLF